MTKNLNNAKFLSMKHFVATKNKIKQNIPHILLFLGIAVFYLLTGCPSRVWFGIACPGCGMSRAIEAVLKLDFALAMEMHPLVFLLPVVAVIWFLRKKLPKKLLVFLGIAALLMMLAVYIYRLSTGSDIVYIDFEKGEIYKVLQNFISED